MKWAEAKALYISACGGPSGAAAEAQIHLAEGVRWICSHTDFQEQDSQDTEKFTVAGQDYVDLPADVNNIITVVNLTTGKKLDAEPNGLRGRSLYWEEATGKPAQAEPNFWVRANDRLYLRGTPDDIYILRIVYKEDPAIPEDDSMEAEIPVPDDYHMAVIYHAAISFLALHPEASTSTPNALQTLIAMRDSALQVMEPKAIERFDRRDRFYLRSFRTGGRM